MALKIYHNPRCSKSRATLALIEEAGHSPEIIHYLDTPLDEEALKKLLKALGLTDPRALMRKGEKIYKEMGLSAIDDPDMLISAMAAYPKLIERPIVVKGDIAIIGRPPENVTALL